MQFWSEIILVISNRTRAARSFDFEITRMISGQIALHSVQLPLLIHQINHYPDEKYRGDQLRYPVDSDLFGGKVLSTHLTTGACFAWGRCLFESDRYLLVYFLQSTAFNRDGR